MIESPSVTTVTVRDRASTSIAERKNHEVVVDSAGKAVTPASHMVDSRCSANERLLGVAATQCARAAERTEVDDRDPPPRGADARRYTHRRRTSSNHDEVVLFIHGRSATRGRPTNQEAVRRQREQQEEASACIGGHLLVPCEQNTQQSPASGRRTALQPSHS